jgi:hypothetical protein
MSRFDSIASTSRWLSDGTTTNRAVDRGGQGLQLGALVRLDEILAQPGRLALGFDQFAEQRAAELGRGLRAGFGDGGDRRRRFLHPALLHRQLLLGFDVGLEDFEVVRLRTGFVGVKELADVDALLEHRQHRLELIDARRHGRELGLLLRLLAIERSELGALLVDLLDQQLPLHRDQRPVRLLRRVERLRRIGIVAQHRLEARNVELDGGEVAAEMVALGLVDGRVELDQDLSGGNGLAILDVDRANHSGLERLHDLGAPAGHDLSRRGRDDIDMAEAGPGERHAEHGDDGNADGVAERRRRRLHDLEGGRQERQLVLAA